ncbi:hypothetical protein M407DRAFT_6369 [Tulasnella calospora MUT 4182]|uniref:Uncharacterized protein n=1 Tax=Tulasnella calospora MUT 4182 TaxID=1051891 RepID=A0A0C3QDM5_9AGAM|nr:hypothetical protein M407DRAFT_6368 [Tulasnella calospora MUT 4182]KIO29130.1 hypothetical protein M407DRAFT_6369 [Tulasnella calospora MUT 4182]
MVSPICQEEPSLLDPESSQSSPLAGQITPIKYASDTLGHCAYVKEIPLELSIAGNSVGKIYYVLQFEREWSLLESVRYAKFDVRNKIAQVPSVPHQGQGLSR